MYWKKEKIKKKKKKREKENNPGKQTWNENSVLFNNTIQKYQDMALFSIAWPLFSFCLFIQLWRAYFQVAININGMFFWLNIEH